MSHRPGIRNFRRPSITVSAGGGSATLRGARSTLTMRLLRITTRIGARTTPRTTSTTPTPSIITVDAPCPNPPRLPLTPAAPSRASSIVSPLSTLIVLRCFERLLDLCQRLTRVAEQHSRLFVIEQRVVDTRETVAHAPLEDDDVLRTVDIENRHAVDRTRRIVARGRINDIVGADDQHDIGLRKLTIHLVHLQQLIVRNVRLGEQHVHVTGHAASDRVNRVLHVHAALLEISRQLAYCVLRFSDGESVSGHDNHVPRISERNGSILRGRLPNAARQDRKSVV